MPTEEIIKLIERVKKACAYSSDAALARGMGMSPQNFLSRKKTGGIKDELILHAINRGANKEWLLAGEGKMLAASPQDAISDEPPETDIPDDLSESDRERIRKVKEIFQSRDEVAKAVLRKGIDGLTIEDRVARLESEVAAIKYGQEEILQRLKEFSPPDSKTGSTG